MAKTNNVCFCKCHQNGKQKCPKCVSLHLSQEKPATHPNDKQNPNY